MSAPMFTREELTGFSQKLRSLKNLLENHQRAKHPEVAEFVFLIVKAYGCAVLLGERVPTAAFRNKLSTMLHNAKELEDIVLQFVLVDGGTRANVEKEDLKWID